MFWGGRTRVDDNTVFRRGKSLIPASRMLIEESSRVSDERREVTDALSEARDCEVDIFVLLWRILGEGCGWLCGAMQLRAWRGASLYCRGLMVDADVNIWVWETRFRWGMVARDLDVILILLLFIGVANATSSAIGPGSPN
jgi:hypothetical protein